MSGQGAEIRPPPVTWAQRRHLLYLTVNVTDCKKPEIQINPDKLYFKGKSGEGQEYEVTLEFLNEVNPDTSKQSVKDRAIDFIIMKKEAGPYWTRLLKDNKKYHWLKVDFAKWKDEDDQDFEMNEESDFEEMMKQMGGLQSTSNDLNDLVDEE